MYHYHPLITICHSSVWYIQQTLAVHNAREQKLFCHQSVVTLSNISTKKKKCIFQLKANIFWSDKMLPQGILFQKKDSYIINHNNNSYSIYSYIQIGIHFRLKIYDIARILISFPRYYRILYKCICWSASLSTSFSTYTS